MVFVGDFGEEDVELVRKVPSSCCERSSAETSTITDTHVLNAEAVSFGLSLFGLVDKHNTRDSPPAPKTHESCCFLTL